MRAGTTVAEAHCREGVLDHLDEISRYGPNWTDRELIVANFDTILYCGILSGWRYSAVMVESSTVAFGSMRSLAFLVAEFL